MRLRDLPRMFVNGRHIYFHPEEIDGNPPARWQVVLSRTWNRIVCGIYGHNPMLLQMAPEGPAYCADCDEYVGRKRSAFPVWRFTGTEPRLEMPDMSFVRKYKEIRGKETCN